LVFEDYCFIVIDLVRSAASNLGYYEAEAGDEDWTLLWTDSAPPLEKILQLKIFQVEIVE
jgi:hypothetical protein